jgi:hypothetical protein
MTIQIVQLILLAFALFMVYVLFLHLKKRNITPIMFGAWILIWLIFTLLVVFPRLLEPFINNVFMVKVMDLIMVLAFMVLTYVTVENNIKIKKFEEKIEVLVRRMSSIK